MRWARISTTSTGAHSTLASTTPRRIIREALLDDAPVASIAATQVQAAPVPPTTPVRTPYRVPVDGPTPYDSEAT